MLIYHFPPWIEVFFRLVLFFRPVWRSRPGRGPQTEKSSVLPLCCSRRGKRGLSKTHFFFSGRKRMVFEIQRKRGLMALLKRRKKRYGGGRLYAYGMDPSRPQPSAGGTGKGVWSYLPAAWQADHAGRRAGPVGDPLRPFLSERPGAPQAGASGRPVNSPGSPHTWRCAR